MDPLDFAPPPAYDDQEFDQKVTRATQISLEAPPTHTQNSEISEERWAEIEEAAFQAAIAASLVESSGSGSAGQSSSHIEPGPPSPSANRALLSTTQPLRIEKKGKVSVDLKQGKDRPSWLPEADGPSSRYEASGSGLESNPFDGDDIAPPPFADIAPHGSSHFAPESDPQPYQQPVSGQTSATTSPALSDTSLLPNLDALSISASLSGHEWSRPHTPAQRSGGQGLMPNTEQTYNHYRQSLPASPSQTMGQHYEERRPHSATSPTFAAAAQATMYSRPSPAVPMVNFNPSVAYGKTAMRYAPAPAVVIQQEPQEEVYRANAFYNASVSAHLTPQRKNNERTTSSNHPPSSFHRSYSSGNSPQPAYQRYESPGVQSIPLTPSASTGQQWQPNYSPQNRPMSVNSVDTVYSSNGVSQQQYLATANYIQAQHSGHTGWAPATPDRQIQTNYYR